MRNKNKTQIKIRNLVEVLEKNKMCTNRVGGKK